MGNNYLWCQSEFLLVIYIPLVSPIMNDMIQLQRNNVCYSTASLAFAMPNYSLFLQKMDLNKCRICQNNQGVSFLFGTSSELAISAKIMHCCSKVIITEGDGLPPHICEHCAAELATAYDFVLKCEATDKFLRSQADYCANPVERSPFETDGLKPKFEVKIENVRELDRQYDDDFSSGHVGDLIIKSEDAYNKKTFTKTNCKDVSGNTKVCTVCEHKSTSLSAHKIHMRTHTGEKPFSCDNCGKKYRDTGSLKRHRERKHNKISRERNFICENCGKGFYSKNDVKVHMRTHTGETPYKCTECPLSFTQIGAMLRHKRRHTGEKPYACPICSKGFCSKEEMKLHYQGVHSDEKKYSCTICNIHYKYKNSLRKHLHFHTQPNSFVCSHCGQAFHQKGNLKGHIERLHSEKSGYCNICLKNVSNLEMHMWKHTGQRPLKCELCSSSFFETKSLARHVNYRHKNTDKYKCSQEGCATRFASQSMLDFHIVKLHETRIPFPCNRCSRGFYRRNDLARHKIGTHKEKLVE